MTLRDLGELVIWVAAVLAALMTIGAFFRLVVVPPIKRHMTKEWSGVKENTDKLLAEIAPENGVKISDRMSALEQRFSDHLMTHSK